MSETLEIVTAVIVLLVIVVFGGLAFIASVCDLEEPDDAP